MAIRVEQKGDHMGAIYCANDYGEEEICMINENLEAVLEKFIKECQSITADI